MNRNLITRALLILVLLGASATAWASTMNAWLDRNRIAEGETVRLTLEAPGQVQERPDTTPLEKDFELLGLSTGSRVNIINGRTDARTTWTLTLNPKHGGTLTIPALRAGPYQSAALSLTVSDAPAPDAESGADILIETDIEPGAPYVQGQVLYTVQLLHAVPVSGGRLSDPALDNVLVQRLGEDREYATTRHGRRYQVVERRYVLFPQVSGPLEVPAPVFDGEIPDASRRRASPFKRFFGNDPFFGSDPFEDLMTPTRRVRVRGETARLDVRPRPDTALGRHWLPAEQIALGGDWEPDTTTIRIGEPVTLTLELKARGLTAGQLPSLAPVSADGLKVYPDQAQRRTDTTAQGVTGHLQQKIAFIPEREGKQMLPAITLHWWDTKSDQERVVELPSHIVEVLPGSGQTTPATTTEPPTAAANHAVTHEPETGQQARLTQAPPTTSLWPWISAVLASGWLLTLLLWWWRHARRNRTVLKDKPAPAEKPDRAAKARKRFLAACQANDMEEAHRSLLAWAAAHWPDDPPLGLEALAGRIQDPDSREALADLNRARYKGAQWNGARLAHCLRHLPDHEPKPETSKTALAPLYPTR